MQKRSVRWGGLAAIATAVVVGGLADPALARKKLSARINGKFFSSGGRVTNAVTNGLGGIVITGIKGLTPGGPHKELVFACSVPGFPNVTFPVTVACGGTYLDTKLTPSPPVRAWATDDGLQVTFKSYNGRKIVGTFSGVFEQPGDTNPTDPPAPVQNGKFALKLLGG